MMVKFLFYLMFLLGIFKFLSIRNHLLMILLCMEFIMLSLFMIFFFNLGFIFSEAYILGVFMVFMVCEGVIGLSFLVSMIRVYGNDYFQSMSILSC
uniref:NADH dehydrogenase subunit 4L n=1 Tax=Chimarra paramonorum TaxID=2484723 RepID=UPI0022DCDE23|nr:NADH dehydrogenase subunit 4L [Chimarra paramonorum]UZZ43853.1 NADH dehydrogenase subunit 4L [Chimarra paramonorum]